MFRALRAIAWLDLLILAGKGFCIGLVASASLFIIGATVASIATGIVAAWKDYSIPRMMVLGTGLGITAPAAYTWFWFIGIQGTAWFAFFFACFLGSWLVACTTKKFR